jgi:hypothetical protein
MRTFTCRSTFLYVFEATTLQSVCTLHVVTFHIVGTVHVLPCPRHQQKIDFYASILSLVAIFVGVVDVAAHVAMLLC